jgi:hypothetical protein
MFFIALNAMRTREDTFFIELSRWFRLKPLLIPAKPKRRPGGKRHQSIFLFAVPAVRTNRAYLHSWRIAAYKPGIASKLS